MLSLLFHIFDEIGSIDSFGKAGEVLDEGGNGKLAPRLMALNHQRLQICTSGIDGGGVSGTTGANDHNVTHEFQVGTDSHAIRCKKGVRVSERPFFPYCYGR